MAKTYRPRSKGRRISRSVGPILACALVALAVLTVRADQNDKGTSAKDLYQQASYQEDAAGKLDVAIALYQRVLAAKPDRALAAQAQLHIGMCYEKLGKPARQAFEMVLRNYPDQVEPVAQARARLATNSGTTSAGDIGIHAEQVWTNDFIDGRPSPDGRYFPWPNYPAGVGHGGGGNLSLHDLVTGKDRDLTHATDKSFADSPFFAPDGKHILYTWYADRPADDWSFRIINADGSSERTLASVLPRGPGAASPDGTVAAIPIRQNGAEQLAIVNLSTGKLTALKSVEWRQPQIGNFSPDGRYLVYSVLLRQDSQDREVYAIAIDGSSDAKLVAAPGANRTPFFTPDGRRVVFASNRSGGRWDLWSVRFANGRTEQAPELVKPNVGSVTSLGFASDGTFYYRQDVDQLDAYEADVDPLTWRITNAAKRISDRFIGVSGAPRWSPDGSSLAYVTLRDSTARYDGGDVTFVVRPDGSSREREVIAPMRSVAAAAFFRWFPDKKSLLLVEYAPAGRAFRRLDLATGQARTLFEAKQSALSAIVSADGRAILYPVTDLENRRMKHLMLRDLEGGEEKSVLDTETGGDGSAAFQGLTGSPDGRLVAYIGSGPQAKESDRAIWVASVPGGEPRELWRPKDKQFSSIQFLTWDAHGRGVLVSVKSNEPARGDEVWYVPVDGGAPHAIGITMPGLVVSSVHPDNQHIGLTASSSTEQLWTLKNLFADNRSAR